MLNIAQKKSALKLILAGLLFSAFIASLIGLFQFIGRVELFGKVCEPLDFFKTNLGRMLIIPREYRGLNVNFSTQQIYSTLYNSNFVGSFMGMALLLSVVLFIYDTNKTRKVIFCILSLLIFSNWAGCLSRAGYVGVISAVLIFIVIVILRFILLKKKADRDLIKSFSRNAAIIVSVLIGLFFVLDLSSKSSISRQFSRLYVKSEPDEIIDVKITSDTILYLTSSTEMQIRLVSNDLQFFSGDGSRLVPTFKKSDASYRFDCPNYSKYRFSLDKNYILSLYYGEALINIAITNQGFKIFDARYGVSDVKKTPCWGFKGMEGWGSNRGYEWSRTIPLLKNVVFLGNGPDTFAFYFPQQDYIAKLKYFGDPYIIVDKPHNMYLQTAVNTGCVSLISILIIFISYVVTSIKIMFNNDRRTVYSIVSLGVFLGNTAYMIAALSNDSLISVAPVFWIMLGLGYAVNFVVIEGIKIPDIGIVRM